MALPPTKLYRFLDDDPATFVKNLSEAGMLKWFCDTKKATQAVTEAVNRYDQRDNDLPGPNRDDVMMEAIRPFLGLRARLLDSKKEWD